MSPPRLAPLSIGRWRSHIPWPRRLLSSREARPPMLPRHMGAHPWRTPLVRSGHGGRAVRYQVSCHQLRLAHRHSPGHFATSTPCIPLCVGGKSEGQGSKGRGTPIRWQCHTYQSPVTSRSPSGPGSPAHRCPGPYYRRPGKVVGRVLTCPPHTHGPTAAATSGSDRYRARSPAGRWLHHARCWDARMSCRVPEWRHR